MQIIEKSINNVIFRIKQELDLFPKDKVLEMSLDFYQEILDLNRILRGEKNANN